MLWLTIENDRQKYAKQYKNTYAKFVQRVWDEQWKKISYVNQGKGKRQTSMAVPSPK
jgi:hypothetical protein